MKEVSRLLSLGLTNVEVAKQLEIHKDTVSRVKGYVMQADLRSRKNVSLLHKAFKSLIKTGSESTKTTLVTKFMPIAQEQFQEQPIVSNNAAQVSININQDRFSTATPSSTPLDQSEGAIINVEPDTEG
jgi:hypothetical protein